MAYATIHGIICSLENPARSHMWDTSFLNSGLSAVKQSLQTVLFHHCMFGSKRKKRTKLLVNHSCLGDLNRDCDQSHEHDGWGYTSHSWATSLEVEYPHLLCRAWANCLRQAALQHGALAMPLEMNQDDGMNLNLQAKAALSVPVRGKRLKPLMREHSHIMTITGPHAALAALPNKVQKAVVLPASCHSSPPSLVVPEHAKQLYAPLLLQGGVAGQTDNQTDNDTWQVEYGIPWQPMEFVKKASGLSHPGHFLDGLHEVLQSLMDKLANTPPHVLAMERTAAMRKWSMRFAELKSQGITGLESSPAHVKEVLAGKNMALFAELIEASGSPDLGLASNIAKGFDLMGPMPAGGVYPKKPLYATLLPEQVREMATLAREAVWSAVRRSKNDEMCQDIYNSTLDECSKGWMSGPIPFDKLPKHAVVTRRFGVKQSSTLSDGSKVLKFRPIDDYTESLINVTNACDETIQPMGVDQICAALVKRMRIQPGCDLVCKTIDLRKAYKNLPISESALDDAYIAVYSPESGVPLAFQTKVLPFGARAAVMGFCRTSYAIWRIGVVVFGLHWTVYFDDYFLVAEIHESKHVDMAQQLLFMILNWKTSDEKEGGFSHLARILGVQIDMADSRLGAAVVSNVESRVRELVSSIDSVLSRGTLSSAEIKVLRGRLVFAEAQIFGRLTGVHMKQLSRFENLVGGTQLDDEVRRNLLFMRDRVLNAEPRKLLADVGYVYHLYTDACFEAGSGGLGGVLFDGSGNMLSFFSEKMSDAAMELVNPLKKKGVIFELETLATAIGVTHLMPHQRFALVTVLSFSWTMNLLWHDWFQGLVACPQTTCCSMQFFSGNLMFEQCAGMNGWPVMQMWQTTHPEASMITLMPRCGSVWIRKDSSVT